MTKTMTMQTITITKTNRKTIEETGEGENDEGEDNVGVTNETKVIVVHTNTTTPIVMLRSIQCNATTCNTNTKKTVTEEQTESERHGWFHSVIEKTTTEDTIRLHAVTIVPIQSRRNDLDDHRDDRQQETIDGTLIDWSCCSVGEEREMKKEETANRNLDTNTNINTITPTTTTTTGSSRSNISTDPSLSLLIKRSRVLTAVGGMVSFFASILRGQHTGCRTRKNNSLGFHV